MAWHTWPNHRSRITEAVQRWQGYDGFFSRDNVAALTEAIDHAERFSHGGALDRGSGSARAAVAEWTPRQQRRNRRIGAQGWAGRRRQPTWWSSG